jgi:uncharacterized membrane protein
LIAIILDNYCFRVLSKSKIIDLKDKVLLNKYITLVLNQRGIMKPLAILLSTFFIFCSISYLLLDHVSLAFCGKFSFSLMLIFTAIIHYVHTDGLELTMPDNFSDKYKRVIVLATGDLEIAFAAGLLIDEISKNVAILIMLYLLAIIPSNIISAIKKVSVERENFTGRGMFYLWLRIPLQVFFMAWVYYFGAFL